ncbi:MAG: hypothetical protein ACTSR2_01080 [Candidatus Hodarchaeales archaeon]
MTKTNEIVNYNEKYVFLLEDLRSIIVESVWISRIELIKGKWLIGQRIVNDPSYEKIQGQKNKRSFIQKIARDLGRSQSDIYACVRFYEKYQFNDFSNVLEKLPEGKNISWYKLVNKYLPDTRRERTKTEKKIKCPNCGYIFTLE